MQPLIACRTDAEVPLAGLCALFVASSFFASCSPSPEGTAKANEAKYVAKKLNDPDSYKPVDGGTLTPIQVFLSLRKRPKAGKMEKYNA